MIYYGDLLLLPIILPSSLTSHSCYIFVNKPDSNSSTLLIPLNTESHFFRTFRW